MRAFAALSVLFDGGVSLCRRCREREPSGWQQPFDEFFRPVV
jgi:hypothetical protein